MKGCRAAASPRLAIGDRARDRVPGADAERERLLASGWAGSQTAWVSEWDALAPLITPEGFDKDGRFNTGLTIHVL